MYVHIYTFKCILQVPFVLIALVGEVSAQVNLELTFSPANDNSPPVSAKLTC